MAENVTENPTNDAGASAEGGQQGTPASGANPKATPTTIDWSTVDVSQIPVDVIKKAPAYK